MWLWNFFGHVCVGNEFTLLETMSEGLYLQLSGPIQVVFQTIKQNHWQFFFFTFNIVFII